ncbi:putative oxidoreductase protein [Fulvimarina pelagi HTCC2506]|uniref:NAD-binding oxidoreductase n=2 Tax=Fulvimarina pelagi TaxID=217511 RepID=A0A0P0ZAM4_9HYPH|nr:Gfo/Idh/MocA family oxidoreductase [Fulvimarina pelagi]EAU41037.1 putative oxidoreductase protein [Fulvimarina pelagi HTCC2506]BAT30947.1 NAD-binding oxidoreductase [Fulvimarina pelagi]
MAIEGRDDKRGRRIRLGMVGGGQGAFIGAVHRLAARIDDRFELVAGALSSTPEKAKASAAEIGLDPARSYGAYEEMARAEKEREDGIEAVAIVTPNHMHFPVAKTFLEAGYHVICDKPVTTTKAEAEELGEIVKRSGKAFALTHNYTGYPMIRQARAMIEAGELGAIRIVKAEYIQDFLATKVEDTGSKQATWRVDPSKAGAGGTIGDVGTHAFNLACFATGLTVDSLACELTSFGEGRVLDDNAQMLLRFKERDGVAAKGSLWASQVAVGHENGLSLVIVGTKGGLSWHQEDPNKLWFTPLNEPKQLLTRAGASGLDAANRVTRVPAGHPEGYLEGFATLYAEAADLIAALDEGRTPPEGLRVVTIEDGIEGMAFIEACVKSSKSDGAWTKL